MTLILEQTPSRYKNKMGDMENLNFNAIEIVKDKKVAVHGKVGMEGLSGILSALLSHAAFQIRS